MKTSDLIGPALDWAVAKCEGTKVTMQYSKPHGVFWINDASMEYYELAYSTDWAQGGPIIERERMNVRDEVTQWASWVWDSTRCGDVSYYGPTPLIAAMRCYVASKLGDEVDIPEELL